MAEFESETTMGEDLGLGIEGGNEGRGGEWEDGGRAGEGEEEGREGEDEGKSGHRLPLARVKKIMKADPDLQLTSQDAVFVIAKATVIIIEVIV